MCAKEHLAALVAIGVEVADDALRLFGDLEEVLLLGDLLVLAVAVLDPLLSLLLLTLHRQDALTLDLKIMSHSHLNINQTYGRALCKVGPSQGQV